MRGWVKICGLSTPDTLEAALAAGIDAVGFVRFPPSPRHLDDAALRGLSRQAAGRAHRVLLLVDPDDAALDATLAAAEPDAIQLHGYETPERAAAVGARSGRPVIKALGIRDAADLLALDRYRGAADRLLLDAKPPAGAKLPGGNGVAFDWTLLAGLRVDQGKASAQAAVAADLILSGGLHPGNVAAAIAATGLRAVDVSSGVESTPGIKDPVRIDAFVAAARAAFAAAADGSRTEP